MSYEIIKVANGFVIRKADRLGSAICIENAFVFNSWGDASSWLQKQFDKKSED